MGRYSRKHMIEFANFAKSYQSPKNVEKAYGAYLKGIKIVNNSGDSFSMKLLKADKVFLNGNVIKDYKCNKDLDNIASVLPIMYENGDVVIESWNNKSRVLILKR